MKPPLKKPPPFEAANLFGVELRGAEVMVIDQPIVPMTPERALNLAAWLAAVAGCNETDLANAFRHVRLKGFFCTQCNRQCSSAYYVVIGKVYCACCAARWPVTKGQQRHIERTVLGSVLGIPIQTDPSIPTPTNVKIGSGVAAQRCEECGTELHTFTGANGEAGLSCDTCGWSWDYVK